MFPAGWPGRALLLLRSSVAVALLFDGYAHRSALPVWIQGVAGLISLSLFAGIFTPVCAVLALVLHGAIWIGLGVDSAWLAVVISLDAVALALLGPGAYSVDSARFGRRVVILPPS